MNQQTIEVSLKKVVQEIYISDQLTFILKMLMVQKHTLLRSKMLRLNYTIMTLRDYQLLLLGLR